MQMLRLRSGLLLLIIALIVGVMPLSRLKAQDTNPTIITVAVPGIGRDAITEQVLAAFEAANPGVKVQVVSADNAIPDPALGLDKHFEEMNKYASAADVLYVSQNILSVEATRAGYFLDLSPLVNEDKTLNVDDFYPALWQSFQWDKGIWALPTAANLYVLSYKPGAFDKANLAYPTDKWTLDDLSNAVNALTEKDASGKVTRHGIGVFSTYSTAVLFRSLLGEGLYDDSTVPSTPQIDKPAVEALADAWNKLNTDGLIGTDLNEAPLSVSPATAVLFQNALNAEDKRQSVLLPGGSAGLDVQGFAVSKGTLYPDKAYALAAFLTTRVETSNRFAATPARKSLVGKTGDTGGFQLNLPPDMQAFVDTAVSKAIPLSEMRFANYLAAAVQKMGIAKTDAKTELKTIETQAVSNLQAAADKKDSLTIVVATPVPDTSVVAGKAALKFGVLSFVRPLPNKDKWDKLVADFTASDPQIGAVKVEQPGGFTFSADQMADKYDCFYMPVNSVPDVNIAKLLSLDPFITADGTFDKADVVGNVLDQLTRDNKLWALPVNIEPSVLKYNADKFEKAGVPAPENGWTVDGFADAVKQLKVDSADPAPFAAAQTGGTHLLILMAAYGGLPLDFRTTPPTLNYHDPATITAMKQVLDLAKNGYIKYDEIGKIGFNFGGGQTPDASILTQALNQFNFRGQQDTNAATNTAYKPVTYPKGKQYNAVSYTIGTVYVSATTQNADGCYRFISEVSRNPDLFGAMPARRSFINDPALATAQGADTVALYNQIDTLLKDPNTISVPSLFGAGGGRQTSALDQFWLFRVFDDYVLRDKDLEAGLGDAEQKSKALAECVATLPPFDASSADSAREFIKQYGKCVVKIDPSFAPIFALIGG